MPVAVGGHAQSVADVGEHRADADGRRPEVEGQHHDAEDDQAALHAAAAPTSRQHRAGAAPAVGAGCEDRAMRGRRPRRAAARAAGHAGTRWPSGSARSRRRSSRSSASTPPRRRASTSPWSRAPTHSEADIARALYDDRTVVKQLAMRRTLFALPARAAARGVGERVASGWRTQLHTRLAKEVEANGIAKNGATWLTRTFNADPAPRSRTDGPATTAELRERLPTLGAAPGDLARQVLRRQLPDRQPGDRHARRQRTDPARAATPATGASSRPRLDADRGLARHAARPGVARGRLPRAGRAVAAPVRPRHRGRPRLVAGRDQGRRTPCAGRPRGGRGLA